MLIHGGTLWFGDDSDRLTEVEAAHYGRGKVFQTFALLLTNGLPADQFVAGAAYAGLGSIANEEESRWAVFIDHADIKFGELSMLNQLKQSPGPDTWMLVDVGSFVHGELARAGYQATVILRVPEVPPRASEILPELKDLLTRAIETIKAATR